MIYTIYLSAIIFLLHHYSFTKSLYKIFTVLILYGLIINSLWGERERFLQWTPCFRVCYYDWFYFNNFMNYCLYRKSLLIYNDFEDKIKLSLFHFNIWFQSYRLIILGIIPFITAQRERGRMEDVNMNMYVLKNRINQLNNIKI